MPSGFHWASTPYVTSLPTQRLKSKNPNRFVCKIPRADELGTGPVQRRGRAGNPRGSGHLRSPGGRCLGRGGRIAAAQFLQSGAVGRVALRVPCRSQKEASHSCLIETTHHLQDFAHPQYDYSRSHFQGVSLVPSGNLNRWILSILILWVDEILHQLRNPGRMIPP